tara:strand:- start:1105 stop:2241 length:1137 start_codon:yes stop_codon:yes gene_type:complete
MKKIKIIVYILIYFPILTISQSLTSSTSIDITKFWHQEPGGYTYPINIFVPEGDIPDGGFPVCILLHGNGGNGGGMINQFKNTLKCHILVAPSGYSKSWNICDEASDAPDLEMVDELINQIQTYSNINPNKIRILGSSNGAGLANNLFIQNKNSGVDIVCAIVSHLNEPQFHLGGFYASSSSTDPTASYCGYDSLVYPLKTRKYLSVSNENDAIIPYDGGSSVVGVDFLDAETAAFNIASNQGYSGSKTTTGIIIGRPEITEYSYLSGDVVHIKGDAEHGTNTTQKEYIKSFFEDCILDLGTTRLTEDKLTIYPNPTSGNILINTPNHVDEVKIYSTNGILLLKSSSKSFDVSYLSEGIYIIEISFKDRVSRSKIFKK